MIWPAGSHQGQEELSGRGLRAPRMERDWVRVRWWRRGAGGLPEDLEEEGDGEGWPEQEQGGKRGWVRGVEGSGGVSGGGSN